MAATSRKLDTTPRASTTQPLASPPGHDGTESRTQREGKVNCMTEPECHACLLMDEMQIIRGLIYYPSADPVLGIPTIPLADGSLPPDTWLPMALNLCWLVSPQEYLFIYYFL
ncbi:hypothetical protein HPB50_011746 [Hyalomma asiaticum]|uniref:Uncharacterized protein n=1 Tax=Hyalomma asiaticum TaxID=266040 RepID=A0ACB7SBS3_HYAAI|nr:hypothetical protein HPB50_011746 [Hyalomma asiaticum]